MDHPECKRFQEAIRKFGYENLSFAVYNETPMIIHLDFIESYFDVEYDILTTVEPYVQMYILIKATKREF